MEHQSARIDLWQGGAAPTAAEIEDVMRDQGLDPYVWSNGPGDRYAVHTHPYQKVLYVVRGSITFTFIGSGHQVTLFPGDRLNLPPGIAHEAEVGPEGVVCMEAHRP